MRGSTLYRREGQPAGSAGVLRLDRDLARVTNAYYQDQTTLDLNGLLAASARSGFSDVFKVGGNASFLYAAQIFLRPIIFRAI